MKNQYAVLAVLALLGSTTAVFGGETDRRVFPPTAAEKQELSAMKQKAQDEVCKEDSSKCERTPSSAADAHEARDNTPKRDDSWKIRNPRTM